MNREELTDFIEWIKTQSAKKYLNNNLKPYSLTIMSKKR
jgi:hypothetical protein